MNRLLLAIVCLAAASAAPAGVVDSDTAAHAAYQDGWTSGDDGSTDVSLLGGWVMAASYPKASIETSAGLGSGMTDIDTEGKSFKLHNPDGGFLDAFRFIDPLGLDAGETFSIDLAVNFRGGFKGIDARDAKEKNIFTFNVGADDYVVSNAATGNGSIGNEYNAHSVFRIRFTQKDESGGTWEVVRSGGVSGTAMGTYSGRLRSIKLYNAGQGAGPENALFFNNLQITSDTP